MNAGDLTTIENVRAWVTIQAGGQSDVQVARLISAMSSLIANVLDRDLLTLGGQGIGKVSAIGSDAGGSFIQLTAPLPVIPQPGAIVTDLTTAAAAADAVATPSIGFVNTASRLYVVTGGQVAGDTLFVECYLPRVETYNGLGSTKLELREWPLVASRVTSVTVDTAVIPQSTGPDVSGWKLDDSDGLAGAPRGPVSLGPQYLTLTGFYFNRGRQNVQVSYAPGFSGPQDDIQQTCIDLVALKYTERSRVGQSGITIAGEHMSYTKADAAALAGLVRAGLGSHRRIMPRWS